MRLPLSTLAPLRVALVALALGTTANAAGCLVCNDIGCAGGLEWKAQPLEGGAMPLGEYRLAIELDDGTYDFDCSIVLRSRESECVPADDNDDEFELTIEVSSYQSSEEWDRDAPPGSFLVRAWVFEGKDDRSTRGPRDVHVVLERDGDELVDAVYDIDYERDEDFAGSKRCGFCDELESRAADWVEG